MQAGFSHSKHKVWKLIRLMPLAFCLLACAPSGNPTSEDLIKTAPPTFSGLSSQNFTTPSVVFDLFGECDPKSFGLEYSLDGSEWLTLDGGCVEGAFKVRLTVYKSKTVYARALTKKGRTAAAQATVRFVLPPTSPVFQMVTASRSQDEMAGSGQVTMSSTIPGEVLSNADHTLNSNIVGVVYGAK